MATFTGTWLTGPPSSNSLPSILLGGNTPAMLMLDRTASLTGPVLMITSSPVRISTATTDSGNASSDVHPAKSDMLLAHPDNGAF